MMPPGIATVIDFAITPITDRAIFRLALWNKAPALRIAGAALPAPCRAITSGDLRILWLEAGHWLITCPTATATETAASIAAQIGDNGTLVEVGGALAGRQLRGGGWRELLMFGGVFDAESPGFAPGCVARTVMHHASLLIDVVADDHVNAYVPASYAEDFFPFWESRVGKSSA